MNKYLNDIGVLDDDFCVPFTTSGCGEEGQDRFLAQRRTYGFDSRETFSLNITAAMWLYEHLMMYADCCTDSDTFLSVPVDLNYKTFALELVNVDEVIWDEDNYNDLDKYVSISSPAVMTQFDAIMVCCEYLKSYIQSETWYAGWKVGDIDNLLKNHKKTRRPDLILKTVSTAKAKQAFRIFAELFPAMWR